MRQPQVSHTGNTALFVLCCGQANGLSPRMSQESSLLEGRLTFWHKSCPRRVILKLNSRASQDHMVPMGYVQSLERGPGAHQQILNSQERNTSTWKRHSGQGRAKFTSDIHDCLLCHFPRSPISFLTSFIPFSSQVHFLLYPLPSRVLFLLLLFVSLLLELFHPAF